MFAATSGAAILPPWSTLTRSRGPLAVAVLAGVLHLVVGFFYLAGGLVIPGYVLLPLWVGLVPAGVVAGDPGAPQLVVDPAAPGRGRGPLRRRDHRRRAGPRLAG